MSEADNINTKIFKRNIYGCCVAFLFFMLAHAYGILNFPIAHDSMSEYYLFGNVDYAGIPDYILKIRAGRFIEVLYKALLGGKFALPWLSGMLSMLWICGFTVLILNLFEIDDLVDITISAGLLVTNITVTATLATYMHDADTNFLGLLFAGLAAFLWSKKQKGYLLGIPFVILCLGCYQSYFCVIITLIMFKCILALMRGCKTKHVCISGTKGIVMLVAGGLLYLALYRITVKIFGTTIGGNFGTLGHATTMPFIKRLIRTYDKWGTMTFGPISVYPHRVIQGICLLIAAAGMLAGIAYLCSRKYKISGKALTLGLVLLLPLGMNATYFLCPPGVTDLSMYAYWLFYLLVFIMIRQMEKPCLDRRKSFSIFKRVAFLLISVLIWSNIQTSNAAYTLREMQNMATLSTMTRVFDQIEKTDGYTEGETEICLIGAPELDVPEGFERVSDLSGISFGGPLSIDIRIKSYASYYLGKDIKMMEIEDRRKLFENKYVEMMPVFPQEGSVQMIDHAIVVKLREIDDPTVGK